MGSIHKEDMDEGDVMEESLDTHRWIESNRAEGTFLEFALSIFSVFAFFYKKSFGDVSLI